MSWRASKAPLCEVDTDMCRSPHLERINRLMNRLFRPQWCNQDDPTFSHWTLSWHKEAHYCSVQTDPSEPCLDGHLQEGSVWMWATLYYYLEFCDVLSDQLHKLKKQRQKKKILLDGGTSFSHFLSVLLWHGDALFLEKNVITNLEACEILLGGELFGVSSMSSKVNLVKAVKKWPVSTEKKKKKRDYILLKSLLNN